MATYSKTSGMGGAWVDKTKIAQGTKVKILTESAPTMETFKGEAKERNVVKLRIEGDSEPKNFDLGKPNINGLIEAFGEDSKNWMGHTLTAMTETVIVGGRRGKAMYLIPQGFEMSEDTGGYVVIKRIGETPGQAPATPQAPVDDFDAQPISYPDDEINPEDIPF